MVAAPQGARASSQGRGASLTGSGSSTSFCFMPARARRTQTPAHAKPSLRFSPINGIFLAAGIGAVIAGYALLSAGSIVAAPLFLVFGYAVLIPLGIIL